MSRSKNKKRKKLANIIVKLIIMMILIIIATFLYARFIGTTGIKVKEYKITNSNIPDNFYGFKIVHFSDVHYGRTINDNELKKIVNKINYLNPDLIVFTGDLIDKDTKINEKQINSLISILSKLDARVGKYYITGNHDYEFKDFSTIMNNSGFNNIDNNYDIIYNDGFKPLLLAGISTNLYLNKDNTTVEEKSKNISNYITSLTDNNDENLPKYKILMIHEPDFIDDLNINDYNLILAGHSHNGQVKVPGIGAVILPPGSKKYYDDYYNFNGTDLYISSGLGTSRYDLRLFNRPSINFYRLVNK